MIFIKSFGFKRSGPPENADVIIDCRRIKDPGAIAKFHAMNGLQDPIIRAVASNKHFPNMMYRGISAYYEAKLKGKQNVFIAFGCVGGRHRSVVCVEWLALVLKGLKIDESIETFHIEQGDWPEHVGVNDE